MAKTYNKIKQMRLFFATLSCLSAACAIKKGVKPVYPDAAIATCKESIEWLKETRE